MSKPTASSIFQNASVYTIHGGFGFGQQVAIGNENSSATSYCSSGGSGTLYVRNGVSAAHSGSIRVYNHNHSTLAATLLEQMPLHVAAIEISDHAVAASKDNITLPLLPQCSSKSYTNNSVNSTDTYTYQGRCSAISLSNATLVSLVNTSNVITAINGKPYVVINGTEYSGPLNTTLFLLQADVLAVQSSLIAGLDYLSSFGISVGAISLSADSAVRSGNIMRQHSLISAVLRSTRLGAFK